MTDNSMVAERVANYDCDEVDSTFHSSDIGSKWIQKSIREIELKQYPSIGLYVIVNNETNEDQVFDKLDQQVLSEEEVVEFNTWRQAYSKSLQIFEDNLEG